jgi:hypothetical protein
MRNLPVAFVKALLSRETSELAVKLVEISHSSITTIRLCNDKQAFTSNGNVYQPWGFRIAFPNDVRGEAGTSVLSIDNIDQAVLASLQTAFAAAIKNGDDVIVKYRLVLASAPNTLAIDESYICRTFNWSDEMINCTLQSKFPFDEPIPGDNITPDKFPGAFRK